MTTYDPTEVTGRLSAVERGERTAAAAAVAEWLFPLWTRYSQPADATTVRDALDAVWECVRSGKGDVAGVEPDLDPLTPHEDDGDDSAALAECALSAAVYAARAWDQDSAEEAEAGVRQLYIAADHVVESVLPEDESLDVDGREALGDQLLAEALQAIDDALAGASSGREDFRRRGERWTDQISAKGGLQPGGGEA